MLETPLLEATAEISIALAGFIGIFLALDTRDEKLRASDVVSIRSIVSCSVAPVFYAVIPILASTLGLREPEVWRFSSGVVIIVSSAFWWSVMFSIRPLPQEERRIDSRFVLILGPLCGAIALICHILNVASWPWTASAGLYLLAIWLIILIAATYFVHLIFNRVL